MAVLASYKTHTNDGESIYRDIGGNKYDGAAQPFTIAQGTPMNVSTMMAELRKTGSPTEALRFRIFSDSAGSPNVSLGGTTVAAASVTGSYTEITSGAPSTTVTLQPSTTYWFVVDTANQGTNDTTYFQWGMGNSSIPYSSSKYKYNGSFNPETGWNMYFEIVGVVASTTYDQTYTESVTVTATIIKATTRVLSEAKTVTDSIVRSITRTLSDAVTGTATFLGEKIISVILTEAKTVTDTFSRAWTHLSTYTESITPTDTITRLIGRVLSETQTATDVFARAWTASITLVESITATDIKRILINGSNVVWTHITKSAAAAWTHISRN